MLDRFYTFLRDCRRAAEIIDSEQTLTYRLSRGISIFLISVFAASLVSAQGALARQTGHGANKVPAQMSMPSEGAIPEAWPANVPIERLSDVGRHKAVIFSPDFAERGNRELYERLGFLY